MKPEIKTQPPQLRHVDFCISTFENSEGLEQLLHSLADDSRFAGARIYIADSSRQLDRSYYKTLRTELGEAGLLNRLTIHHVAYKANLAESRNFLVNNSKSKYKLFLTDSDVVTEKTDILKMVSILDGNKAVGVVGGGIEGDKGLEHDGKVIEQNGVKFAKATATSEFILMRADVKNVVRYDPNSENPHRTFCNAIKTAPYEMVIVDGPEIGRLKDNSDSDAEKEEGVQTTPETPDSNSDGNTSERSVQSGDEGDKGKEDGLPSGKDEEGKNPATSRRQGRSSS